jgi:hypothetical protein
MCRTTTYFPERGETYIDEKLRKRAGIKKGGRVRGSVTDGRLIIETLPTLEDMLSSPVMTISAKEAEALSEKAQKEEGVFG